jgi:hypothetical protein
MKFMDNEKEMIKEFLNAFFKSLQLTEGMRYYILNKNRIRTIFNKYDKYVAKNSVGTMYFKLVSLVQKYQDIFSHFGISVDYENEILYYNKIVVLLE